MLNSYPVNPMSISDAIYNCAIAQSPITAMAAARPLINAIKGRDPIKAILKQKTLKVSMQDRYVCLKEWDQYLNQPGFNMEDRGICKALVLTYWLVK